MCSHSTKFVGCLVSFNQWRKNLILYRKSYAQIHCRIAKSAQDYFGRCFWFTDNHGTAGLREHASLIFFFCSHMQIFFDYGTVGAEHLCHAIVAKFDLILALWHCVSSRLTSLINWLWDYGSRDIVHFLLRIIKCPSQTSTKPNWKNLFTIYCGLKDWSLTSRFPQRNFATVRLMRFRAWSKQVLFSLGDPGTAAMFSLCSRLVFHVSFHKMSHDC